MNYRISNKDFTKAFEFSIKYFLNRINHSGRTSGEPRGLGAVIDSFIRGKLIEIGVKKMLESCYPSKKVLLDFDIKKISEVYDDPDIVKVRENEQDRFPKVFVEIKNTSIKDKWIGLTEEQMHTIESSSKGRIVENIYCSLNVADSSDNPSKKDLLGMFMKTISNNSLFEDFSNAPIEANLEFILSTTDLKNLGTRFPAGSFMYDTNLFKKCASVYKNDGSFKKGISFLRDYSGQSTLVLQRKDGTPDETYGSVEIIGKFSLYTKNNAKSNPSYILCKSEVFIESKIFGRFSFCEGDFIEFNLITVGKDPILKRNNIWIAKRRITQLIDQKILGNPNDRLEQISKQI